MDSTGEIRRERGSPNVVPLYEKHAGRLTRYVRARVDSAAEAEDIVQEVFLQICQGDVIGRAKVNPEVYLLGIARHLVAKHLRQKKSEREARQVRVHTQSQTQINSGVVDIDVAEMSYLLKRLSPMAREAIRLRYVQGCGSREAARRLGCSENAFHVRLHRALKALRELIRPGE